MSEVQHSPLFFASSTKGPLAEPEIEMLPEKCPPSIAMIVRQEMAKRGLVTKTLAPALGLSRAKLGHLLKKGNWPQSVVTALDHEFGRTGDESLHVIGELRERWFGCMMASAFSRALSTVIGHMYHDTMAAIGYPDLAIVAEEERQAELSGQEVTP